MRAGSSTLPRCIAIVLACLAVRGQPGTEVFEVASVKPASSGDPLRRASRKGGPGTTSPSLYSCQSCPLVRVVSEAYGIRLPAFELSAPEWFQTAQFDISAKVPPGTTRDSFHKMLRNLLAERFKLAAHYEKREMKVYELAIAKSGLKFQESVPSENQPDEPKGPIPAGKLQIGKDGFPVLRPGMSVAATTGHTRIRSQNQPIDWLLDVLQSSLPIPIVDATALTAKYDFVLSWAYRERSSSTAAEAAEAAAELDIDDYIPALMKAAEAQLGLTLSQRTRPVGVLMVDHANRTPTVN